MPGGGEVAGEKFHVLETGRTFEQPRESFLRLWRVVHAGDKRAAKHDFRAARRNEVQVAENRRGRDARQLTLRNPFPMISVLVVMIMKAPGSCW